MTTLSNDEKKELAPISEEENRQLLNKESLEILNQIITESDPVKTTDLAQLFNVNQKKKTMARLDKMGKLLDTIADTAIKRFTTRPDELSNQEMLQAIKVVQGAIESEQKILGGVASVDTPLIQINQQTNSLNLGETEMLPTKESRENVMNAVKDILASLSANSIPQPDADIIEIEDEGN